MDTEYILDKIQNLEKEVTLLKKYNAYNTYKLDILETVFTDMNFFIFREKYLFTNYFKNSVFLMLIAEKEYPEIYKEAEEFAKGKYQDYRDRMLIAARYIYIKLRNMPNKAYKNELERLETHTGIAIYLDPQSLDEKIKAKKFISNMVVPPSESINYLGKHDPKAMEQIQRLRLESITIYDKLINSTSDIEKSDIINQIQAKTEEIKSKYEEMYVKK